MNIVTITVITIFSMRFFFLFAFPSRKYEQNIKIALVTASKFNVIPFNSLKQAKKKKNNENNE